MLHTERKKNAKKQLSGDAIHSLLYPHAQRDKVEQKNHHLENLKKLRQTQQQRKATLEREQEEALIKQVRIKAKNDCKYGHVASKLYDSKMPSPNISRADSLASSMGNLSISTAITQPNQPKKYPSPQDVYLPPSTRKLKTGEVPKYLINRKATWAAEQATKMHEQEILKAGGKPGHVLLRPEERAVIIEGLETKAEEIRKEIMRLPVTLKSKRLQDRKETLERELNQIEEDREKFQMNCKIWIPEETSRQGSEIGDEVDPHHDDVGVPKVESHWFPLGKTETNHALPNESIRHDDQLTEKITSWLSPKSK